MTSKQKAEDLVHTFGKENALKVIEDIWNRYRQWVEKFSLEYNEWSVEDIEKSEKIFNEIKDEIEKHY